MSRAKKKHVCSCGEEFNHGIGLRKHQRQTGHKGSSVVDDDGGGDTPPAASPPAAAAAAPEPPAAAAAPPPPPPAPAAPAPPAPTPPPAAPITAAAPPVATPNDDDDDDIDQTVAVSRVAPTAYAPRPEESAWEHSEEPSRYQHNRQKLTLVSSGLKVIAKSHARAAGQQLKQSARSGADIFTEAAKIATALLVILSVPAIAFWWWWSQRQATPPPVNVPNSFTVEEGALAARSTLLQYLDALEKEQWDEAYGRLSQGWQDEMSSASFRDAFSGIDNIRWAVSDQRLLTDGTAEVRLLLAYLEDGTAKKFQGRFRLVRQGTLWKVDRAELSSASS